MSLAKEPLKPELDGSLILGDEVVPTAKAEPSESKKIEDHDLSMFLLLTIIWLDVYRSQTLSAAQATLKAANQQQVRLLQASFH